jgi:hypothetical protein
VVQAVTVAELDHRQISKSAWLDTARRE